MEELFKKLNELTSLYRAHGLNDEIMMQRLEEIEEVLKPFGYTSTIDDYLAAFVIVPRDEEE